MTVDGLETLTARTRVITPSIRRTTTMIENVVIVAVKHASGDVNTIKVLRSRSGQTRNVQPLVAQYLRCSTV